MPCFSNTRIEARHDGRMSDVGPGKWPPALGDAHTGGTGRPPCRAQRSPRGLARLVPAWRAGGSDVV